jgi:hypothetical protein
MTDRAKKKKKRLDWCCNVCDHPRRLFASLQEVIAHYRKSHPDYGYSLWDIGGDLGDRIGNSAMEQMRDRCRAAERVAQESAAKAKAYDELSERFSALCRALQIGHSAMEAYRDAWEKEKK